MSDFKLAPKGTKYGVLSQHGSTVSFKYWHECDHCGGWGDDGLPREELSNTVKAARIERRDGSVFVLCSNCFAKALLGGLKAYACGRCPQ